MTAQANIHAQQRAQSAATITSAVGSLQRRLMLAYGTFTSATLALLIFSLMSVGFATQLHAGGLYRIAYSTELEQNVVRVAQLSQDLADGTLQRHALDGRLGEMVFAKAMFTTDAYAELVAPDGVVLGRSASPRPAWVGEWLPDGIPENMAFDHDSNRQLRAHVIARQEIESNTEIRSPEGELLGHLKTRYRFRNMELVYWLAGGMIWLLVVAITWCLGSLFGWWAARPLAHRLAIIAQTSEQWARGDFGQHLHDTGDDEISRLSERLNAMAEQLRALLAQRHVLATTEERQRLARELHDSVKQQVFAISMHLGAVGVALPRDAVQAHALLHDAQGMIQATHAELAALIFALRPTSPQARGLVHGLAELAAGWRIRGTTALTFSTTGSIPPVPVDIEHMLLRVAQEAVVNALRHSAAHEVTIVVRGEGDTVTLTIADNGVGFDPDGAHVGLGLVSMRTRMQEIGGTLTIQSAPGQGTRVVASWQVQVV
jgi:signal transduction histidine kinase